MQPDAPSTAIHILVVDNEQSGFDSLAAGFLNDPLFAHNIDYAPTIADCLRMLAAQSYDIFIIRFRLRVDKKNGLNLVYYLRDQGCKIPAILLTEDDTERLCADTCSKHSISRCVPQSQQTPSLLISIIADTLLHFKNAD